MEAEATTPNLPLAVLSEQTYLRIPTCLDWIEPTVEYLKNKAVACGVCQESRALKLTLALHEAFTNSLIHGNLELASDLKEQSANAFALALAARAADPRYASRFLHVRVSYDGDRCVWVLTDEGKGFNVEEVLRRSVGVGPDCVLASGRGIALMRAFLDDVHYELGGRRVVLTLLRTSGEEKRQHARQAFQGRVQVAPIRPDGSPDWEAAYEAVARNLSSDGMALLQSRLESTDRILIGLFTHGNPIYLPAEIRHWQTIGDNVVELGCRFESPPQPGPSSPPLSVPAEEQALDALVARCSHDPLAPDDRRDFPRVRYTERIGIVSDAADEVQYGFARDLSKGGIAFIATAPLPYVEKRLLLPQGEDHLPLAVRAQVVRCTKIGDGFYDVGARFVCAKLPPPAANPQATALAEAPAD
jgi:anti-sigma regulatory factor (Ser/Thr protein kinase)